MKLVKLGIGYTKGNPLWLYNVLISRICSFLQHQKATKANKDLLEKSVATAAVECEFSGGADQFSDDESGDDDDDDDDDDDEEDDDDDEDDDDEEEEDDEIIVKDTSTTTKESSDNEKTEVKKPAEEEEVQTTESSSAAENAANVKEYSGKRTKGLPIKGVKRSRGSTDASVESNEDSIKKAKKEQPNTQAKKAAAAAKKEVSQHFSFCCRISLTICFAQLFYSHFLAYQEKTQNHLKTKAFQRQKNPWNHTSTSWNTTLPRDY